METTPAAQPNTQNGTSAQNSPNRPLPQFNEFTDQFVKTMEGVSKLAEKGPSNLLLTLGTVLVISALAMKLKLLGMDVSNLHPTEFITIVLAGLALLAGGSYLRFYQYVSYQKLGKDFSDKMLSMAEKTIDIAERTVTSTSGQEGAPKL